MVESLFDRMLWTDVILPDNAFYALPKKGRFWKLSNEISRVSYPRAHFTFKRINIKYRQVIISKSYINVRYGFVLYRVLGYGTLHRQESTDDMK